MNRIPVSSGQSAECPRLERQGMVVRLSGNEQPPFQRGDANSDGALDLSDAIFILRNLFLGGPPPREPRVCGADPTLDGLSCLSHASCDH